MLSLGYLKNFFKKADGKNHDEVARRVAGDDELVKGFIKEHEGCAIRAAPAGDAEFVECLAERHEELSGYTGHPERLFCVSFDSLPEGRMGIPERPTLRVYVDVKKEKIVTTDASNYRQVPV